MAEILPLYTTRTNLEEAGVPTTCWSDARVNNLIATVGAQISEITAQTFIARGETFYISGDERSICHRPDLLPILFIDELSVAWGDTNGRGRVFQGVLGDINQSRTALFSLSDVTSATTYTSSEFKLRPHGLPRYIELIRGHFPGGSNNLQVTGVVGWPELASIKATPFTSTTVEDILEDSDVIELVSTAGLSRRDVLIVAGHPFIVQSVNHTDKVVTVDKPTGLLPATIAEDTVATAYAAVPRGIERVANFMCMREVVRQAQWAAGNFVDPSLIQSEKTDKYEYKVHTPASLIGFGMPAGMTGVAEIDEILAHYSAPPYIDFA